MLAMTADVKQFNVYLPKDLIRDIKYAAIEREQSLSGLVEEAIRKHLEDLRRRAQKRRKGQ